MERIRLIFKKILSFFHYIFFGKDWKSDLLFTIFFIAIFLTIQNIFPFFSAVVSSSMEHTNFNCNKYIKFNITCEDFQKFPFKDGISVGSLVIIVPTSFEDIKVGDVILYKNKDGKEILHRVIYKNDSYLCLMGDNNYMPLPGECPLEGKIIGKAIAAIPYLGYPRYLIFRYFSV